jgi:hypothetical protein
MQLCLAAVIMLHRCTLTQLLQRQLKSVYRLMSADNHAKYCPDCRNVPAAAAMCSAAAAFSTSRLSRRMLAAAAAAAAPARLGDSLHSVYTPSLIVDLDGRSPFSYLFYHRHYSLQQQHTCTTATQAAASIQRVGSFMQTSSCPPFQATVLPYKCTASLQQMIYQVLHPMHITAGTCAADPCSVITLLFTLISTAQTRVASQVFWCWLHVQCVSATASS